MAELADQILRLLSEAIGLFDALTKRLLGLFDPVECIPRRVLSLPRSALRPRYELPLSRSI